MHISIDNSHKYMYTHSLIMRIHIILVTESLMTYNLSQERDNMSTSEAQLRASKKYHDKFEKLQIRVTPEEKVAVERHVETTEESVNSFVRRAIAETISRDLNK